ncbi:MAG TPA: response regulator [Bryobacteraceae bacterium]|jgi:DNA-binding response OmpR family regulator|nr:response regulator [Bryobacteraceae bacterium]
MRNNCATIMVFHSAPVVRTVLREILQREGYVVRATGDLGIAVDMVRETPPDLLLIDVYVADISGHDAALYLCKKNPNMQVLMVAGVPDDQRMEARTTDEGFSVFPKPFAAADLVAKVKEILAEIAGETKKPV